MNLPNGKSDFIRITKAISLLDAILMPDWAFRYYSFNANWDKNEMMASMRNGEGDYWYALITDNGIAVTGYVNGQTQNKTIFNDLPRCFENNLILEPAFQTNICSFCLWNIDGENKWNIRVTNDQPESIDELFIVINEDPKYYWTFAERYYERKINKAIVEKVFRNEKISENEIRELNSKISLEDLWEEILGINY